MFKKYRIGQFFLWAKRHTCCKLHVWTILRVRFAHVSKPLNWSAITTKITGTIELFSKFYTKGRNLTFKIVYSTGLGGSQRNTETENRHEETRQNRSSALGSLRAIHLASRLHLPCTYNMPWSCIFRNWSRFGSYNVYLYDTRISYTSL